MQTAKRVWLKFVDNAMAAIMIAMFATFILQIVTRYLAKYRIGGDFVWTQDFAQTLMVWVVFFGGAFALAESDHVKFDMVYNMFGVRVRRAMAIITAVSIVAFFAWSLPAALDSWLGQLFRWNKPNPTLKFPLSGGVAIPMWAIYSIYAIFAVAIIVRYAGRAIRLIGGATPEDIDNLPALAGEERAP